MYKVIIFLVSLLYVYLRLNYIELIDCIFPPILGNLKSSLSPVLILFAEGTFVGRPRFIAVEHK